MGPLVWASLLCAPSFSAPSTSTPMTKLVSVISLSYQRPILSDIYIKLEFLETRNHDQNHLKHFFATTDNSLIGKRDFRARIFARLAVFYFSSSSNPFLTALTEDSVMKEVSVAVDGEEARISFVDHMHGEMSVIMIMIMMRTHECDLVLMKI